MTRRRMRTPKGQPRPASMTPGMVKTGCRNCGEAIRGDYCSSCGQEADIHGRTLREYLVDISYDFLSIDGKIWLGFRDLVSQPGRLTKDYLDGRRASRPVPSRLFLVMSVLTFGLVPLVMSWFSGPDVASGSALLQSYDTISPLLSQLGLPDILSEDVLQSLRDHETIAALISVIPLAAVLALYRRPTTAMFSGHAAHAFHLTAAMLLFGMFGYLGMWAVIPTIIGVSWYAYGGYQRQDSVGRKHFRRLILWWILAWVVAVSWFAVGIFITTTQAPSGATEINLVDSNSVIITAPLLFMFLVSIFLVGSSLEIMYVARSIMCVSQISFRSAVWQAMAVTFVVLVVRTLLVVATIATAS